MAAIPFPSKPLEPVDPTYCPTCFSGIQPVEPPYVVAIEADY